MSNPDFLIANGVRYVKDGWNQNHQNNCVASGPALQGRSVPDYVWKVIADDQKRILEELRNRTANYSDIGA